MWEIPFVAGGGWGRMNEMYSDGVWDHLVALRPKLEPFRSLYGKRWRDLGVQVAEHSKVTRSVDD